MKANNDYGVWLEKKRKSLGRNVKQMVELLGEGISYQNYRDIVTSRAMPKSHLIMKKMAGLGFNPGEVFKK